jgi:site-specific DNA-methyltransferase (adenine-specific)
MVETGPGWTLTCADCLGPEGLSTIADKSVDHVITDPPYSEQVHAGRDVTRHPNGSEVARIDFGSLSQETPFALAAEASRVTTQWVAVFCADHSLGEWMRALSTPGLRYMRSGVWIKTDAMPQMSGDRPAHGFELLALAHSTQKAKWNGGGKVGTYTGTKNGAGKNPHPTTKPEWLMLALVSDFTDPGELVCDPFAGSGTTGVACIRLGRRFVGFEKDPKYFAVAVKRLRAAREQLGLFERPAVEKFKQANLSGVK